jgi:predicted DNA-binding transcriptional regulator AlpA
VNPRPPQLVEHSHLPVRRTLVKLGVPRATFYRWYDLYRIGEPDALGDRSPRWIASGTNVSLRFVFCHHSVT